MPENNPQNTLIKQVKEHLRFYRYTDVKNQSVRALARYCRVTEQTIFNWLKGKTMPNRAKLKLMQEWLEQRKPLTNPRELDTMPLDLRKGLRMTPILFLPCILDLVVYYICGRRRNDVISRRFFCFRPVVS